MLKKTSYSKGMLALLIVVALLTACSKGNEENSLIADATTYPRSLELNNTSVNNLSAIIICFNQVQLKRNKADGADLTFNVGGENGLIATNDLCLDDNNNVIANTAGINLIDFIKSDSINLITGTVIDVGEYTNLQVAMSEGSYGIDSKTGEKIKVSVPSNILQLDGFTAAIGGVINFTLEFDLRKSMTNPVGQEGYVLKPNGIRLVDNSKLSIAAM
ncbi:MAG: DUF4382 domain-containing protein [Colwellia sp.]|nr:DUF4382 domain-containing protein [Colwellia sp.]